MKTTYTRWSDGRLVRTQVPFLLTRLSVMRWQWRAVCAGLEMHDAVWSLVCWVAWLAVAGCVLTGCGTPPPPRTITVSPNMPEAIQVAAQRAADAWCSAPVGWCPELVDDGGDSVILVGDAAGNADFVAATNNGRRLLISARTVAEGWTADDLTGPLLHEFGHYGIDGHTRDGLMAPRFEYALEIPHEVDPVAVAEWCEQQGC